MRFQFLFTSAAACLFVVLLTLVVCTASEIDETLQDDHHGEINHGADRHQPEEGGEEYEEDDRDDEDGAPEEEGEDEEGGQLFTADDQFDFGQSTNVSSLRVSVNETSEGLKWGLYDGLLSPTIVAILRTYLNIDNEGWLFNNYDEEIRNNQDDMSNTAWTNNRDPKEFSQTKLCERILLGINDLSAGDYYPYKVTGKINRQSDHTKVSVDSEEEDGMSALVFLNRRWRKNYYGEMYLYDSAREIIGGSFHVSGRVVVWDSRVPFLNRPPAITFTQGQILLHVRFSKNATKMELAHQKWQEKKRERDEAYKTWHLPEYNLAAVKDPAEHVKFAFTSQTGLKLFVYDNLFPRDMLDHLRAFVLSHGTYFYDDHLDEGSDNVQWIAGFPLNEYISSPFWKIIKRAGSHASGSDQMFPYDISINLIRSGDHTKIHNDTSYPGEIEYTVLVYLNHDWEKNNYGETTFFESDSDDTEIMAQVRPRFGRCVVFDGNIPHSARPPSFNFSGARLTFVTKLSKSELEGREKNVKEELRHFSSTLGRLAQASGSDENEVERRSHKYQRALKKARLQTDETLAVDTIQKIYGVMKKEDKTNMAKLRKAVATIL